MRKREIHSVAHWAMMFILLMFPILMVGISGLGKSTYKETLVQSVQPLVSVNNYVDYETYHVTGLNVDTQTTFNISILYRDISIDVYDTFGFDRSLNVVGFEQNQYNTNGGYYTKPYYLDENNTLQIGAQVWTGMGKTLKEFTFIANRELSTASTYWKVSGSTVVSFILDVQQELDYRYDINEWINAFIDLPINGWYKSLMNVIGVGFTNSTVMNVIYVMPVYILWVFIFDVIVDCFLVIIKLPHKLLNRLSGGENE